MTKGRLMPHADSDKSNFPPDIEERLGFTSIRAELVAFCENEVGRYFAGRVAFMPPSRALRSELDMLGEMMRLRVSADLPSFAFPPIREHIKGLAPQGSTLSVEGAVAVKKLLGIAGSVQGLPLPEEMPLLSKIIDGMDSLPPIRRLLDSLIGDDGEIKDTASETLREIRSELRSLEGSIGQTLQRILVEARTQGWVEKDASPTMRDGRLLLPVIPSAKRNIGGIVHEESASGRTLFMEPEKVVALNNRIRETKNEEQREINRLLRQAAERIRPFLNVLRSDTVALGRLDLLHAKALLAASEDALIPTLSAVAGAMEWWKARHPILERHLSEQGKALVPLNIKLSPENRILVISGPNAGGKSATLKTVGLLQYMLQCGLAVPMQSHSVCTLFDRILLDIGDQQSLEDDLSTYSSHLRNMKHFVRNVTDRTLVLIDEFGGGTEPAIGGAIAEALLDNFRRSGTYGVITTHYGNLKDYSETHDGVINGAMLFDRQKIKPLYQLYIGQPGSSFAIEIARSIGLPGEILDYASGLVGEDYMAQDKYLQDIMRDKAYWASKRGEIKRLERELEEKKNKLDERLSKIQDKRDEIISKAHSQALDIVTSANAAVEKTIRDIKTHAADKEETQKARERLQKKRTRLEQKKEPRRPKAEERVRDTRPLEPGDKVKLESGNAVGEVVAVEGKKAQVIMGALTMWFPMEKLSRTSEKATEARPAANRVIEAQTDEHKLNFKPQLDVRGMRVDEALQTVTHYLDDAGRFGFSPVRILHGTGTGALRTAIRQLLESNPRVRAYRDEHVDFGGAGITIVEL